MKKSWFLTNGILTFGLLPAVIVACSNNNVNSDSNNQTPKPQTIVAKEIQRIEELKTKLSLKVKNPTVEKISKLNTTNILQQLDNWTEGTIENQPGAKFIYTVKNFNNGLSTNSAVKTLSFKSQLVIKTTKVIRVWLKLNIKLKPDNPNHQQFCQSNY